VTFIALDIEGHKPQNLQNSWVGEKAQNMVAYNGKLNGIVVLSNLLQA
jgi:hypothetical protein